MEGELNRQGSGVRRSEIVAALSIATDFAMGQPAEFALRACVLAMRLAKALNLAPQELTEVFYQAQLRYIGCNAESYSLAALFGDELDLRRDFALADNGKPFEVLNIVIKHLRQANAHAPPVSRFLSVLQGVVTGGSLAAANFEGHCEVAQRLAERLGFGSGVVRALGQLYERWDGRGLPNRLKGEAIAPAVRIVTLAQDVVAMRDAHDDETAIAMVKRRRGKAYDPRIADCFLFHAREWLDEIAHAPSWQQILALDPEPQGELCEDELDALCLVMADFADLKSPFAIGHSRAVAELAAEAARVVGLPPADVISIRRAALLHDIGQVALSAAVFTKPARLSDGEWERVRLHPYYTERILARPAALARLGAIAAYHHERADGSGYHRAARVDSISPSARILAAADAYCAMTEARSYREALSSYDAAEQLKLEVRLGRFDGDAVSAVLTAAGHRTAPLRSAFAGGLTEREVDVLRLLSRGRTTKQIGTALGISAKTADNHIQNLYGKIAVSTRAGATLFAVENGLLGE
ncbi:MAG: HD domain-containing protein [Proteobacteria bacterium]|nr:HD domain-containing protein [Pseudomonadota bacterium]